MVRCSNRSARDFQSWSGGGGGSGSGARTRLPLLLGIAVIAACAGRTTAPAPPLDVMSFNVRYGTAPDGENSWTARRELVRRVIRTVAPDLLGVQEALRFQLDEIAPAMPHSGEVGVGRDDGIQAGEYAAILYDTTRLTVLAHGTFWLSDTPDVPGSMTWGNQYPRLVTWARFRDAASAAVFLALNTHWDHESQHARERGARQIVEWLAIHAASAEPVLLMGDFNANADNPAIRMLLGAATPGVVLTDTYRAVHGEASGVSTFHAFTGNPSGDRIDAIFASPHWRILDAAIVRTSADGRYPSDHFPVTARVRVRRR